MDVPITEKLTLPKIEQRVALLPQATLLAEPIFAMGNVVAESVRALEQSAAQMRIAVQPFQDLQAQFVQMAKLAVQPVTQIVQVAEHIEAAFRETLEPFEKMREAFAAIQPTQLEALQRTFAGFGDELRIALERDDVGGPAFKLFAKLGLTGLESYLSMRECEYILKISKTKGNRAVQQYVFHMFRSNRHRLLNRMIRDWWTVPYMRKRKRTVRAAINAHKKKKYELAIPTLLPFIDGLAAEIIPNSGSRKPIVTKEVAEMYRKQESELWGECVEQPVYALIYRNYDFHKAKRPPSSVNRHGILHGRIVDYGTELNSYRVILLLNVIVKMATQNVKKTKP
jgi:hypothetical protein